MWPCGSIFERTQKQFILKTNNWQFSQLLIMLQSDLCCYFGQEVFIRCSKTWPVAFSEPFLLFLGFYCSSLAFFYGLWAGIQTKKSERHAGMQVRDTFLKFLWILSFFLQKSCCNPAGTSNGLEKFSFLVIVFIMEYVEGSYKISCSVLNLFWHIWRWNWSIIDS